MGVTVGDVAEAAKVSATTVSLCFQENSRISAKTRQRVLSVAEKLGYVPNQFARRLRSGKSQLIALLVAEMHSPSIIEIISGVERACIEQGYNALVFNTFRDIEIEKKVVQSACELKVEGIIVMASEEKNERLLQLCESHFPLVYLNSLPPIPDCSHIIYDMEMITKTGMGYLLGLGHRRILLVTSEENSKKFSSFAHFEKAYGKALKKQGIKIDPRLIRYGGTTIEDGRNAVTNVIQEGVDFSAVFAICDEAALGVIEGLEQHGKRVPIDVSVLGIDNISTSALSRIGLTTIEMYNTSSDEKNLGTLAAKMLLRAIGNNGESPVEFLVLKPNLIERQSCRRILSGSE